MMIFYGFVASTLLVMAFIAVTNALFFYRRLTNYTQQSADNAPLVSILIPARNEAHHIGDTVQRLCRLDYPALEIIMLDDDSTDDTATIAQNAATGDPRFRLISGEPLPDGWTGKNWACHQLAQAASGDLLVFTDADVKWQPDALRAAVNYMTQSNADLVSVWSTQETVSAGERLIVPLMMFVLMAYLPLGLVHHTRFSAFAAANGQCMIWRKTAYQQIGGHAAVANVVLEDVTLARLAKRSRFRIRLIDAAGLLRCRMYDNWAAVRDGFAKNILAGYGGSVTLLLLATVFHWLVFIVPLLLAVIGIRPALNLALYLLAVTVRALTAGYTRQRIIDAFTMPLSVILMTRIAMKAIQWHMRGGVQWKDRTITHQSGENDSSWGQNSASSSSARASAD